MSTSGGGMEVEVEEANVEIYNVMAGTGVQGSVKVQLHPLVIMNISDHWTRMKAQNGKPSQVIGALLGKQEGRLLEIMNSFELSFITSDDVITIDTAYYEKQQKQFKQVFQDLEFLGWYSTGGAPNFSDISVHQQFVTFIDSPVFLKLDPLKTTQLPISMFESVLDLTEKGPTMLFVELSYTLVTEEAERIGLDNMAKFSVNAEGGDTSLAANHLRSQHQAIKMLHSRVKLILEYMKAVQNGTLPASRDILRDVFALCRHLPVVNSDDFREEYYNQCNDVGLQAYLGTLTKCCDTINQYIDRFNILYERQLGRRLSGRLNF